MSVYQENKSEAHSSPFSRVKVARTLFYASIIALCLGIGNITFGNIKYSEYKTALEEIKKERRTAEPQSKISILDTKPTKKTSKQQLRRIRARLSFYDFVILGGKVLLGIAGILLLALLVLIAPTGPGQLDSES